MAVGDRIYFNKGVVDTNIDDAVITDGVIKYLTVATAATIVPETGVTNFTIKNIDRDLATNPITVGPLGPDDYILDLNDVEYFFVLEDTTWHWKAIESKGGTI